MKYPSYSDIPGFQEEAKLAFERQQSIRERSVYGVPEKLAGFEVKFITLKTYSLLRWSENAFVGSGIPSLEDGISFIWLHSVDWVESKGFNKIVSYLRRRKIARKLKSKHLIEINDWISEQFQDLSDGGESKGEAEPPLTSEILHLVALLAREFHWTEEQIINMPIARLWQYRRLIKMYHDPEYKPLQLTDRVVDKYVLKWKELK